METLQNLTNTNPKTDPQPESVVDPEEHLLQMRQQKWIDFNAVGGLITESDGALKPMTISAFALALGVSRQTLYDWKNNIPDFWGRVRDRRKQIGTQTRLEKVYTGLYLKAASGDPAAVKLYLQIFDDWRPPAQAHEIEVTTGLADLISKKKLELERERKVIDATPADTTTDTPNNS